MTLSVAYRYYPSVESAKARLRWAIRADREAVPCGRWVLRSGLCFGPYWWHTSEGVIDARPRLRWEVRR